MSYFNLFADAAPPELGPYPIGVTGTRGGWTEAQKAAFAHICLNLLAAEPTDLLHGGCRDSVDVQAHEWIGAQFPRCMRHVHLGHIEKWQGQFTPGPTCYVYPPRENSIRNATIATRPLVVIGVPAQPYEILRSGTWQTIRMAGAYHRQLAQEKGVIRALYVIQPDGIPLVYKGDFRSEMNPQTVRPGE